jgi:hypothetical protein
LGVASGGICIELTAVYSRFSFRQVDLSRPTGVQVHLQHVAEILNRDSADDSQLLNRECPPGTGAVSHSLLPSICTGFTITQNGFARFGSAMRLIFV